MYLKSVLDNNVIEFISLKLNICAKKPMPSLHIVQEDLSGTQVFDIWIYLNHHMQNVYCYSDVCKLLQLKSLGANKLSVLSNWLSFSIQSQS